MVTRADRQTTTSVRRERPAVTRKVEAGAAGRISEVRVVMAGSFEGAGTPVVPFTSLDSGFARI